MAWSHAAAAAMAWNHAAAAVRVSSRGAAAARVSNRAAVAVTATSHARSAARSGVRSMTTTAASADLTMVAPKTGRSVAAPTSHVLCARSPRPPACRRDPCRPRSTRNLPRHASLPDARTCRRHPRGSHHATRVHATGRTVNLPHFREPSYGARSPWASTYHRAYLLGGYFWSLRCKLRRWMPSRRAASEMFPPASESTRLMCSHSARASDGAR